MHIVFNTQTPPVRPLPGSRGFPHRDVWRVGVDCLPSVGGVVPMVRAVIRASTGSWLSRGTGWVSLGGPGYPSGARLDDGVEARFVNLPEPIRAGYTRFKESIWRSFHGTGTFQFDREGYRCFTDYSFRTARILQGLADSTDAFYIHDFQQIQVGGLLGPLAPAVLRWHIPFNLEMYPPPVRHFFMANLGGYDGIIVSTRRELESLLRAGYRGLAFQIYPHVDPSQYRPAPPGLPGQLREEWDLGDGPVVLCVARMDPQKRQDLLLEAWPYVARRFPRARLVLVGNGSFSGGHGKASQWRTYLEQLVRRHRITGSVRFVGYLEDERLAAAYDLSHLVVLPSPREGFGLVAVEAWLHRRPVLVTEGAGVREIMTRGVDGDVVPAFSSRALARGMARLLAHPRQLESMGERGAETARNCFVDEAIVRIREVFSVVMRGYRQRKRPTRILTGLSGRYADQVHPEE